MRMDYKVETLYDPGTAEPLEDTFVAVAPFFAVFDGVSGVYHPSEGWRSFGGRSGGQIVVALAEEELQKAFPTDTASEVMRRINARVREFAHAQELTQPRDLPGTAFALAKVADAGVELIQGGDAFAVWQSKEGTQGATPNQNYRNEAELVEVVRRLVQKHNGDTRALWDEYIPVLQE